MCPGYFDAPQALACPLAHIPAKLHLDPVTLVFCALNGVSVMKVALPTLGMLAALRCVWSQPQRADVAPNNAVIVIEHE